MCSTSVVRAASDTAIRPLIFSSPVRTTGYVTSRIRDRGIEVCTVATIGPEATQQASKDRLGISGSCTCSTSNPPSLSQRRTRFTDKKPNDSRATEPLYGTGTARPAPTTYGGSGVSSSAGEITETSWPSKISSSARSLMCCCTPPGTSHEYGQAMPILMMVFPPGGDPPGSPRLRGRLPGPSYPPGAGRR